MKRVWLLPLLGLAALAHASVGLKVGEFVPAYDPFHVTGPDKGTETCPVCTYVNRPMVQVFVRDENPSAVGHIIRSLEQTARENSRFRGFVVFLTNPARESAVRQSLASYAAKNGVRKLALCTLARPEGTLDAFSLPARGGFRSATFVHVNRKVTASWLDLSRSDLEDFRREVQAVIQSEN